jgi:oligo-1,6-glucosidase
MQWDASHEGGFTTGTPWLAVNPNHTSINAAAQRSAEHSVFHHHRRLIALRREHPALVHGTYTDLDPAHQQVFAYERALNGARLLVAINWGESPVEWPLPGGRAVGQVLLHNQAGDVPTRGATTISLHGWQALITTPQE